MESQKPSDSRIATLTASGANPLTNMIIQDAVREFIGLKTSGGLSERTTEFYEDNLQPFVKFVGAGSRLVDLDTQTLNKYLEYSAGLSGVVAHEKRFVSLKVFLNQMVWMGYIPVTPLRAKKPKVPKRIIAPFTAQEVQRMLDSCVGTTAHRDKAMIMTLVDSGVRLNELTQMKHRDINFRTGDLFVIGKGAKERNVPLSATTLKNIYRYLKTRRSDLDEVWLSEERNPLTRRGVQQVVKRASLRVFHRSYGPHKFRHTAACAWAEAGIDIKDIARLLGHSSLKQSVEYVEFIRGRHALAEARKVSYVEREKLH